MKDIMLSAKRPGGMKIKAKTPYKSGGAVMDKPKCASGGRIMAGAGSGMGRLQKMGKKPGK